MSDIYYYTGLITFWLGIPATLLFLGTFMADVWRVNRILFWPLARITPDSHVTSRISGIPSPANIPEYVTMLIQHDYGWCKIELPITRRKRHLALIDAITRIYFTKQDYNP